MKTLILILWVALLLMNVVAVIEDPNDPFQTALEEFLSTPDFAIQSEVWTLDDGTWDVRPCAILVYFVGPVAIEDRSDCGLPWAVTAR